MVPQSRCGTLLEAHETIVEGNRHGVSRCRQREEFLEAAHSHLPRLQPRHVPFEGLGHAGNG
jgi:hypothetical protein